MPISTLNITPINALQLGLFLLAGILSIVLTKTIWRKVASEKHKTASSLIKISIRPILNYTLFILMSLLIAMIMYPYTQQLKTFNGVFQVSLIVLVARYIFLLSKSLLLSITAFIGLSSIWLLNYFELLKPSLNNINNFSLTIGSVTLTAGGFLKSILTILTFLWITSVISHYVKARIKKMRRIRANTKEILYKSFDISIYFVTGMLILNILGINLSTLTFIGGALGVGIGFGLQKITSNFISGIILLFEKSIEIDDLIEMDGGIYGFIRKLGSRFTLVETFEGKEILIPNEDFITNRVTNWTFSNKVGRIEIPVGVSYNSDLELVQKLMLDAAREYKSTVEDPSPKCYLREFGDSSVNFALLFFIDDVTPGRMEPQSDVMFAIWKKFKDNKIEIPFPQRDIHIKTDHTK